MKFMTAAIVALSCFVLAASPKAQNDSYRVADQLGVLIGSEELCGLRFDQGSIDDYIRSHVRSDDLDFSENLHVQIAVTRSGNEHMSASEKTARCTQVTRNAKLLQFLK